MKREHIAFLLLMASFAGALAIAAIYGPAARARMAGNTRDALLAQARAAEARGDAEQAGAVYARLSEAYPQSEEILLAHAEFQDRQGRHDKAEALYRQAVSAGRQRFSSVRRYAGFLDRRARSDEALTLYESYLERHGDDPSAQFDLGLRYLALENWDKCERWLRAAAESEVFRTAALARLGDCYMRQQRYDGAIEAWSAVVASGDGLDVKRYLYELGAAHYAKGAAHEAIRSWETYLDLFPRSLAAVMALQEAYERTGDTDGAARMELLRRAFTPPVSIIADLSPSLALYGRGPLEPEMPAGKTFPIELFFRAPRRDIERAAPGIRFWFESGEAAYAVPSQPARAGAAPLWRGDCWRTGFAVRAPVDIAPGRYALVVSAAEQGAPRVSVGEITVTAPGGAP